MKAKLKNKVDKKIYLVDEFVKKYEQSGVDADYLKTIGTIGLIRGIKTSKRLNDNYLKKCIDYEISSCLKKLIVKDKHQAIISEEEYEHIISME